MTGAFGLMEHLESQFGHPRGLLGGFVGMAMALEHRGQAKWAVQCLGVERRDRILEIGFGPGLAIQRIAEIAVDGFVAGIEVSDVMVQQARRRNASAMREGRIQLSRGSAEALPYEDNSFDKALAMNTVHHWPDPDAGLSEVWRVLRPGGVVAVVEGPHSHSSCAGDVQSPADALAARLSAAGFERVTIRYQSEASHSRFCVLGVK